MIRTRRLSRGRPARLLAAGLALALALLVQHAAPPVAVACSCIGPQPLAAYVSEPNNGTVILAGRVEDVDQRGALVAVDRWFAGGPGDAFVVISGDFGNGASCGVGAVPKVGSQWVWVAFRPEPGGDLTISICQPAGELSTPEGQKLLAEAVETFGDVAGPSLPRPTSAPEAPVDATPYVAAGGTVAVGLLILAGAAVLGRRRGRPSAD